MALKKIVASQEELRKRAKDHKYDIQSVTPGKKGAAPAAKPESETMRETMNLLRESVNQQTATMAAQGKALNALTGKLQALGVKREDIVVHNVMPAMPEEFFVTFERDDDLLTKSLTIKVRR